MSLSKALYRSSLLISLACLAGGYVMAGQWLGAGAVLPPILALLFAGRFPVAWLPHACLLSLVCLAAGGLLAGAPAFLMIPGAAAALAAWDLVNLDRVMAGRPSSPTARRYEQQHAVTLAAALGLGLMLAGAGRLLPLQIPFVLLVFLVLVDLFSLDRMSRYLRK